MWFPPATCYPCVSAEDLLGSHLSSTFKIETGVAWWIVSYYILLAPIIYFFLLVLDWWTGASLAQPLHCGSRGCGLFLPFLWLWEEGLQSVDRDKLARQDWQEEEGVYALFMIPSEQHSNDWIPSVYAMHTFGSKQRCKQWCIVISHDTTNDTSLIPTTHKSLCLAVSVTKLYSLAYSWIMTSGCHSGK